MWDMWLDEFFCNFGKACSILYFPRIHKTFDQVPEQKQRANETESISLWKNRDMTGSLRYLHNIWTLVMMWVLLQHSPQRYSMHQAPNLSLYVHLATVQPVQFNTIPIPTDLALTLEACNFPFWRSVWTKYFKHHALHYNSCTVSFKWKPCMLATLSYMNDTQLWILNILYPILLTPWLAVWLTLHCAWMVH